ncbi:hypothetical protein CEUSTIGMA_g10632.t1 [Chlamydomonas eustigma]|uniref:Uncharacterized protein n=1 Tax=Chlamydomonas eustigma TaxID=1157962 RepID=A0A250XJL3_9CHLO|nr:hypothetical protein CEUSTIGMA_g10632.t1 [Chlamydomonas eustigma]|eukprot:GAX83206.1 hypothetical protein CEUSTIGMA_g10632.t1 [Chlamydomonas eustigma]
MSQFNESTRDGYAQSPVYPQSLGNHLWGVKGPSGYTSSTHVETVIKDHGSSCTDRIILIIGATSAIGRAICKSLSVVKTHLVLGCRRIEDAEALALEIKSEPTSLCQITVLACDLSSLKNSADAARAYQELGLPLHTIILTAATSSTLLQFSVDGYEKTYAVNYLAQCLLVQELLPLMAASACSCCGRSLSCSASTASKVAALTALRWGQHNLHTFVPGGVVASPSDTKSLLNSSMETLQHQQPSAGGNVISGVDCSAGEQPSAFDQVTGVDCSAREQPSAFDEVTGVDCSAREQPSAFDEVTGVDCSAREQPSAFDEVTGVDCSAREQPCSKDTSSGHSSVPVIEGKLYDAENLKAQKDFTDKEGGGMKKVLSSEAELNRCSRFCKKHVGRVIFVSCSAHHLSYKSMRGFITPGSWRAAVQMPGVARYYMPVQAYGLSKMAQILYTKELSLRLERYGVPVVVHAVHPGVTAEGIQRFGDLGSGSWLQSIKTLATGGLQSLGLLKTPQQAAASVAYAALAPVNDLSVLARLAPAARNRNPLCHRAHSATTRSSSGSEASALPRARLNDEKALLLDVQDDQEGSLLNSSDSTAVTTSGQCEDGGALLATGAQAEICGKKYHNDVSFSGRYIEDCRLSLPSPEASNPQAASALWQVTQEMISAS